ncbi:hypothetical protein JTE90_027420 [Oedothorax gibbosus]|uniref:Uncharacterized protein n=1 Tax=Oedothorax gibbosus TaxID=931172 RepID=A0AAV6VZ29_9ARAC|nr:hypothetical protein JTE90_027420 [Oedothorax gibbosus]
MSLYFLPVGTIHLSSTMGIVHLVEWNGRKIAFNELNPFPQRVINARRTHHFQIIRAQLEELEIERKKRKSAKSDDNVGTCDYMSEED